MFQPIHTAPTREIVMVITDNGIITPAAKRDNGRWCIATLSINCAEYRANTNSDGLLIPVGWMPMNTAISKLTEK